MADKFELDGKQMADLEKIRHILNSGKVAGVARLEVKLPVKIIFDMETITIIAEWKR